MIGTKILDVLLKRIGTFLCYVKFHRMQDGTKQNALLFSSVSFHFIKNSNPLLEFHLVSF